MNPSHSGATRRLARLERVLAGRRERLADALDDRQVRSTRRARSPRVQQEIYRTALLVAALLIVPKVLGFAVRRRGLLVDVAKEAFAYRMLRNRLDATDSKPRRR